MTKHMRTVQPEVVMKDKRGVEWVRVLQTNKRGVESRSWVKASQLRPIAPAPAPAAIKLVKPFEEV